MTAMLIGMNSVAWAEGNGVRYELITNYAWEENEMAEQVGKLMDLMQKGKDAQVSVNMSNKIAENFSSAGASVTVTLTCSQTRTFVDAGISAAQELVLRNLPGCLKKAETALQTYINNAVEATPPAALKPTKGQPSQPKSPRAPTKEED